MLWLCTLLASSFIPAFTHSYHTTSWLHGYPLLLQSGWLSDHHSSTSIKPSLSFARGAFFYVPDTCSYTNTYLSPGTRQAFLAMSVRYCERFDIATTLNPAALTSLRTLQHRFSIGYLKTNCKHNPMLLLVGQSLRACTSHTVYINDSGAGMSQPHMSVAQLIVISLPCSTFVSDIVPV